MATSGAVFTESLNSEPNADTPSQDKMVYPIVFFSYQIVSGAQDVNYLIHRLHIHIKFSYQI